MICLWIHFIFSHKFSLFNGFLRKCVVARNHVNKSTQCTNTSIFINVFSFGQTNIAACLTVQYLQYLVWYIHQQNCSQWFFFFILFLWVYFSFTDISWRWLGKNIVQNLHKCEREFALMSRLNIFQISTSDNIFTGLHFVFADIYFAKLSFINLFQLVRMRAIKLYAIIVSASTFLSEVGSGRVLRGNERKNQVRNQSFTKDVIHLLIKCELIWFNWFK